MFIVKNRKIFYIFSALLLGASFFALFQYGLKLGIDFKGGSIVEIEYKTAPDIEATKSKVASLGLGEFSVRPTGESGIILRTKDLSDPERKKLITALGAEPVATTSATTSAATGGLIKRFDSVGPILGEELQKKSLWSIILVILAIVLFITFVFRKVSKPVASWKYGLVAIVALVHDVIIPAGVFAYLGHIRGTEIDSLFITALLVVLGFSIHDTIVVFDRTRENLRLNEENKTKKEFETIVSESVTQTFARSINTSLTTIIALVVLYMVGPDATKNFSLALLVGITAGTYSSIFIASPLMVTLEKWQEKKSGK